MNWIDNECISNIKWKPNLDSDVRRLFLLKDTPNSWNNSKKYLFAINTLNKLKNNISSKDYLKKISRDKEFFMKKLNCLKEVGK